MNDVQARTIAVMRAAGNHLVNEAVGRRRFDDEAGNPVWTCLYCGREWLDEEGEHGDACPVANWHDVVGDADE